MQKQKKWFILLWVLSGLFALSAFTYIGQPEFQFSVFLIMLITAGALGFFGYRSYVKYKNTPKVQPPAYRPPAPYSRPTAPTTPAPRPTAAPSYFPPSYPPVSIQYDTIPMTTKKAIRELRQNHNYIVLDLETTGLSYQTDRIVEIGMLRVINGVKGDTFHTLVNPQRSIPAAASRINHITDADVEDAPTFDVIKDDVISFIGDLPIVAYNSNFDAIFLGAAVGNRCRFKYIDALDVARKALPALPNHKLVTVKEHYGIESEAHRALYDVMATQQIFELMCDEILVRVVRRRPEESFYKID